MSKTIMPVFLLFCLLNTQAQQITGYVSDAATGEMLIGAHVIASHSKAAKITNAYGFFSIYVRKNDSLVISYVGYQKKKIPALLSDKDPLNIKLKAASTIDEVAITAKQTIQENIETGSIEIPMQQLKTLPALAGETDIMKALQLMPGIRPVGEGQSSFFVRGGSPDQNMVILDNVPIYYINHLGGFVSVLNTDALNSVKLYKGGFPARYGGRLSSIIDVNTKNGHLNQRHASISLGLVTSKIMLEGPVKEDTLSYFLSARRFMYDLISRPLTYMTNKKKQLGYTFYDINAKINYKPDIHNRLYLSFYSGHDNMLSKQKETKEETTLMDNTSKWGNLATSFRWNHTYGKKLFSNITSYYMQYNYNSRYDYYYEDDDLFITSADFNSGIRDLGLNSDFEYYPFRGMNIKLGTNHIYHSYEPNIYQYGQHQMTTDYAGSLSFSHEEKRIAYENAVYMESELTLIKQLSYNIGYRLGVFTTNHKTYISHEPRATVNINFPDVFALKGSYSVMSQYVHLLTYFGTSIPVDLWMPSTETIPPQNSKIYSIGIYKDLQKHHFEISVEGYYKKMNNLIEYQPGENIFSSNEDWTTFVEKDGKGIAKGLEFLVQRKTGRLSGWISYTLSKTTRQFDHINQGKPYLYTYDATHDFSIHANYKLKDNLTFSAVWSYVTGRAITLPNEYYDTPLFYLKNFDQLSLKNFDPATDYERTALTYEHKNNIRMNPYHRLDVAITYKKHKKRSNRVFTLGVYNLYNRQNAIYYYIGTKESLDDMGRSTGVTEKTIYQVSLFPLIPSISYQWIW